MVLEFVQSTVNVPVKSMLAPVVLVEPKLIDVLDTVQLALSVAVRVIARHPRNLRSWGTL